MNDILTETALKKAKKLEFRKEKPPEFLKEKPLTNLKALWKPQKSC